MEEYNHNLLLGNVFTAIFMIIACYFGTIKFHQTQAGQSSPINDYITIGFIEEEPTVIEKKTTIKSPPSEQRKKANKKVATNKNTKTVRPVQSKVSRNQNGFTELQQDCHDALLGLKVTKKEAQYLVHTIFNKENPNTIQEFLQLAFMRGK
jgi:hypothetical protein